MNGRRRMMRPGRIKRRRRRTRFGNEAGRKMRPIIRMIMIRRGRRRRSLRASLFFDLSICLRHSPYLSRSHFLSLSLSLFFTVLSRSVFFLCSLSLSLSSLFWASVPLGHGAYDSGPLGLSAYGLLGLLLASVSLGPLGFEPLASAPLDSEPLGL